MNYQTAIESAKSSLPTLEQHIMQKIENHNNEIRRFEQIINNMPRHILSMNLTDFNDMIFSTHKIEG